MLKKFLLVGSLLLFGAGILHGQTEIKKWEYLFVDEYSRTNFNELGSKGWEMVGVVPATTSDGNSNRNTKYIFKRPFDLSRNQQEAELKNKNQNGSQSVELVNLDAVEQKSAQKEAEEKAKARIEQEIKNIKGFTVLSFKQSAWFPSANDQRIGGELVIDASRELLRDGNKYRASEADKLIRLAANEIYRAVGLKPRYVGQEIFTPYYSSNQNGVSIKVSVVVIYKGVTKTLTEGSVEGFYQETIK